MDEENSSSNNSSSNIKKIIKEKDEEILADVPKDNNCLFWSVVLAYLIQVKNETHSFEMGFEQLFGNEANEHKNHIRKIICEYPHNKTLMYKDNIFNLLITHFRQRVLNYMRNNPYFKSNYTHQSGTSEPPRFEDYIAQIEELTRGGGKREIQAISMMLLCEISIISEPKGTTSFYPGNKNQNKTSVILTLVDTNSSENTNEAPNYYQFKISRSLIQGEKAFKNIGLITDVVNYINDLMQNLETTTAASFTLFKSQESSQEDTRKNYFQLKQLLKGIKDFEQNDSHWNFFKKICNLQIAIIHLMNTELRQLNSKGLTLQNALNQNHSAELDFIRKCLICHRTLDKILLKYIDVIFQADITEINDYDDTMYIEASYKAAIKKIMERVTIHPENISSTIKDEEDKENAYAFLKVLRQFSLLSLLKICQSGKGISFIQQFSENLAAVNSDIRLEIQGVNKVGFLQMHHQKKIYDIILVEKMPKSYEIPPDQIVIIQNGNDFFYKTFYQHNQQKLLNLGLYASQLNECFIKMKTSQDTQKKLDAEKNDANLYSKLRDCIFHNSRAEHFVQNNVTPQMLDSVIKNAETQSILLNNRGNILLVVIFDVAPLDEFDPNSSPIASYKPPQYITGIGFETSIDRLLNGQFCFDNDLKLFYNPAWIGFFHELIHGYDYMHGFSIELNKQSYFSDDWRWLWTHQNEYQIITAGLMNESMVLIDFNFPERYSHRAITADVILLPMNNRKKRELEIQDIIVNKAENDPNRKKGNNDKCVLS